MTRSGPGPPSKMTIPLVTGVPSSNVTRPRTGYIRPPHPATANASRAAAAKRARPPGREARMGEALRFVGRAIGLRLVALRGGLVGLLGRLLGRLLLGGGRRRQA